MKLQKGVIEEFASKGYELRPTVYSYETYYENSRQYSYNYYDYECYKGWHPDWTDEQIEQNRQEEATKFADNCHTKSRWFSDSSELYVLKNGIIICQIKNLPKSSIVSSDYIQKRIDKAEKAYESYYGGFCMDVQELLRKEQIEQGFSIYPTTYGIGVWIYFNFYASKSIDTVTDLLEKYGIEYYNEFSEARMVYRFKISKKETNRLKLKSQQDYSNDY